LRSISALVLIFAILFVLSTFVMTFYTPDLETASSSVLATLCNIGPGFGEVGATSTYAGILIGGQIILTTLMLLGRLELYTVLVVLVPSFWRR